MFIIKGIIYFGQLWPTIKMWHAGFKYINRKKCILFVNDFTLYSFLLYGVKKNELDNMEQFFKEKLIENLKSENLKEDMIDKIIKKDESVEFIKTNNRSILGSLNDFMRTIPYYIEERSSEYIEYDNQVNLLKLNKKLNRTPMLCSTAKGFFPIEKLKEFIKNK